MWGPRSGTKRHGSQDLGSGFWCRGRATEPNAMAVQALGSGFWCGGRVAEPNAMAVQDLGSGFWVGAAQRNQTPWQYRIWAAVFGVGAAQRNQTPWQYRIWAAVLVGAAQRNQTQGRRDHAIELEVIATEPCSVSVSVREGIRSVISWDAYLRAPVISILAPVC
ncbi:MAG: hypothetical protein LBU32_10565 [Clostridiales bacterium]|nr:hypothetical protein [Clostridiales bacterium]